MIIFSGIFVNAIIANLMVATHYGLGLHTSTVIARDPNYPSNLSKTFRHIWITMVLMSSFFVCIKMTLLYFYKRLFLVGNTKLRIFWWANFVYIVLWFFGSTAFYLFQCKPVQWYFIQYYKRFPHLPIPGNMNGQCNATNVLHVSLPLIFSLISDIGLLLLPLSAISQLKLNKSTKRGLMAVFGIGLVACLLELGRVLDLLIDTDDKTDPSYGVSVFLILTAAEETTAVVCACLPIIVAQLTKKLRARTRSSSYMRDKNVGQGSSEGRSARGFKRVTSLNHLWTIPTTLDASKIYSTHHDDIPMTSVEIVGNSILKDGNKDGASSHRGSLRYEEIGGGSVHPAFSHSRTQQHDTDNITRTIGANPLVYSDIHVRSDIQVEINNTV